MTVSCVSFARIPSSIKDKHIFFAEIFCSISTPIHKPLPLTSFIILHSIDRSSFARYEPISLLFSIKLSSNNKSKAFEATLAASGFPPNVEPCEPGLKCDITSSLLKNADTGKRPPPSAFPKIKPSGTISSC